MTLRIFAPALPNIPWEERPAGSSDLLWRYSRNPVIGRRPLPRVTGIYNSAVVTFKGRFVGVFRIEGMDRVPHLHVGHSPDGLSWTFAPDPIDFRCADPEIARHEYGYDPRITRIDEVFYVTWCNGYHGPTIGVARTKDFADFEQLENAFLPFNRNGVLFPRKVGGKFRDAQPSERRRSHALRRHLLQREPRHGALGTAPPRHEPRWRLVAGREDRRRPFADRDPWAAARAIATPRRSSSTEKADSPESRRWIPRGTRGRPYRVGRLAGCVLNDGKSVLVVAADRDGLYAVRVSKSRSATAATPVR